MAIVSRPNLVYSIGPWLLSCYGQQGECLKHALHSVDCGEVP